MFQGSRHLEKALALVTSELTDLRDQYRMDREAWAAERKELLDRIMALSSPAALREIKPRPPAPMLENAKPLRFNYPGIGTPNTRPPVRTPGLTDEEISVVKAAASED